MPSIITLLFYLLIFLLYPCFQQPIFDCSGEKWWLEGAVGKSGPEHSSNPFHLPLDRETLLSSLTLVLIAIGQADDQRRILCHFCSESQEPQIKGKEVQDDVIL